MWKSITQTLTLNKQNVREWVRFMFHERAHLRDVLKKLGNFLAN